MAYTGAVTSGNEDAQNGIGGTTRITTRTQMAKKIFKPKNPGAPGKLGKNVSSRAESLAKLRGKGALA